jgi:dTDP-4-dehydrorhamnose 3,5-epimerase
MYGEGKSFDDRGSLTYYNSFNPCHMTVQRMYIVENFKEGTIRAWHGHKRQHMWVTVIDGAALICHAEVKDWETPILTGNFRATLTAEQPKMVHLPPGINGSMTLLPNTKIMYFSDYAAEDTQSDDFRFPWNLFGTEMWEVRNR